MKMPWSKKPDSPSELLHRRLTEAIVQHQRAVAASLREVGPKPEESRPNG